MRDSRVPRGRHASMTWEAREAREARERPRHSSTAAPTGVGTAILALVVLAASLALTAGALRICDGGLVVSGITAMGVWAFLIIAMRSEVLRRNMVPVALLYFLAVPAILVLSATDAGPYTGKQAFECLFAYQPMGFGIGLFGGMISATWND